MIEWEKMSKRANKNNNAIKYFEWMLAIDFDPTKYKMDRQTHGSLGKILMS
jgi:hypothetical protein